MPSMFRQLKNSPNYKWWVTVAMAASILMGVADWGLVAVAMPTISAEFNSDLTTVQWLPAGLIIAIIAVLLPMGRLSDIIGRKKVSLWGIAIFGLGAGVASVAPNLAILIAVRILQGLGLGMLLSTQIGIMASVFPQRERGKSLGVHITLIGIGGIIGPALGGLLVDLYGWRSVFLVLVPWAILAFFTILFVLEETQPDQSESTPDAGRFDFLGASLSTIALLAFILAITNGHRLGWSSPAIVSALIGFVILLGIFIRWELRAKSPMLDLTLFKNPVFSLGTAARYLHFCTVASSFILLPFYLHGVLGYSATKSGLIVAMSPVGMVLLGPIGGHLSDRLGWRPFNVGAAVIGAAGFFLLYQVSQNTSLFMIILALVLQGAGAGMFSPPNSSSVLGGVERSRYGIASAILELIRNSANVTGIAAVTVIVAVAMASQGFEASFGSVPSEADPGLVRAFTSGFRTSLLILTGLRVLVAILSFIQGKRSWSETTDGSFQTK